VNETQIKKHLKSISFIPSKKMGQNFLHSNNHKDIILESLDININDIILEIGPGFGAITEKLSKLPNKIFLIELDKRIFEFLKNKYDNIEIINDDILNFDIVNFCKEKNITKVVSNLPYSISAKIITETIQNNSLDLMIFMIQKELAERLFAKPGSKKYNSLSILIQTFTKIEIICDISQSCFYPEPQVKSSLIKLIPNKIDLNFKKYNSFIRLIFSSKRKTLVNNAKNNYPKEKIISILKNLNLSIDIRPEKICVKTMIKIFESLSYED